MIWEGRAHAVMARLSLSGDAAACRAVTALLRLMWHLRRMGRVGQDAAFPKYRTKSGWAVEIVQLTCTPNHRDGNWIRLTHHGFFITIITITDVATVAEPARWIPADQLEHLERDT